MGRCCAVNARRITAHRLRQGHGLAESRHRQHLQRSKQQIGIGPQIGNFQFEVGRHLIDRGWDQTQGRLTVFNPHT